MLPKFLPVMLYVTCNLNHLVVQVLIKLLSTVLSNVEIRQFSLLYNMCL